VILIGTSIWIDHLRSGDAGLARLLGEGAVLGHPWITGELALGNLGSRDEILVLMQGLPQATVASDHEVLTLIKRERLYGSGIGYIDAQLLAAARLPTDTALWTRDKRLLAVTVRLGLDYQPTSPAPLH
jgi:predicted nucleic acid-binding protein